MSHAPRPARPEDLPELLRLEAASFDTDRLSRRSLQRFLRSGTALCLVVDGAREGTLAGYGLWLFRRLSYRARLYSIAVDRAARGQGVAQRLMDAGEQQARQRGRRRVALEVSVGNVGAIGLYRKLGYRETALRRGYYGDGSDALCMVKELAGSTDP